jgi:hypothetical protein
LPRIDETPTHANLTQDDGSRIDCSKNTLFGRSNRSLRYNFVSYTVVDLSLFEPLFDPEGRSGTNYFELHPKELPNQNECWLLGSLFIQDAAFDFFVECFHTASKDFDYFYFQRFGEAEIDALSTDLETFLSALRSTPSREVLFSRYASLFTKDIWSKVETEPLTRAVVSCGESLLKFVREQTKESKCLWVLGM